MVRIETEETHVSLSECELLVMTTYQVLLVV